MKKPKSFADAVYKSLEHWINLDVPRDLDHMWFKKHCVSNNCALCQYFNPDLHMMHTCEKEGEVCPLLLHGGSCGQFKYHSWTNARDCANVGNYAGFMTAKKSIINYLMIKVKDLMCRNDKCIDKCIATLNGNEFCAVFTNDIISHFDKPTSLTIDEVTSLMGTDRPFYYVDEQKLIGHNFKTVTNLDIKITYYKDKYHVTEAHIIGRPISHCYLNLQDVVKVFNKLHQEKIICQ